MKVVIKVYTNRDRYTRRDSSIRPRRNLVGVEMMVVVVASSQRIATSAVYRSRTYPREAFELGLVATR